QLRTQGAPYEVLKIDTVGRHAFVRLKSPRTGRTALLDIAGGRDDPSRIGAIEVLESHAAILDELSWSVDGARGDDAAAQVIARNMKRLAEANAFSGVVYVLEHDKPVYARAFGFASLEDSIPNTLHTRFSLASMGKMFTATAVMQLIDAGKLSLDDTLARVLPKYPNAERARKITIRNLLEHSAGL